MDSIPNTGGITICIHNRNENHHTKSRLIPVTECSLLESKQAICRSVEKMILEQKMKSDKDWMAFVHPEYDWQICLVI